MHNSADNNEMTFQWIFPIHSPLGIYLPDTEYFLYNSMKMKHYIYISQNGEFDLYIIFHLYIFFSLATETLFNYI